MRDKKRYDLIRKFASGKAVLDVGSCSHTHTYGTFLIVKKFAKSALGIDILPSKRKDVLRRNAEDFDLKKAFDVITCFGTLHQMGNAGNALQCFYKHLKKDGILLLGFPYVFAWKYRILGNRLVDLSAVHWFCKRTIKNLLHRHGFKVVAFQTENPISNPELMVIAQKI